MNRRKLIVLSGLAVSLLTALGIWLGLLIRQADTNPASGRNQSIVQPAQDTGLPEMPPVTTP